MEVLYRAMRVSDFDEIIELWKCTKGIGITPSDTLPKIALFLESNPGLCFVAEEEKSIVGTILCGCDGRRAYLYHLAVREESRRKGIGTALVNRCLSRLKEREIEKCHLFVFENNAEAIEYYKNSSWKERMDLKVFSKSL
jgi:ribosomal protein S18 acetylase RimI-like enzyme